MKLIDKDAVIAELEKLYNLEYNDTSNLSCGKKIMLRNILLFLNTIVVKEVDLEKEATEFVQTKEFVKSKESPVLLIAKHFYELGIKSKRNKL